jgi:hypothetical protein
MNQDFTSKFTVHATASEAFDAITRVSEWWTASLEGHSAKLGDVFSVYFGKTHVTMKITEWVKNQKILWTVTDGYLDWLVDKKEWNGTKILWEVQGKDGQATVIMTHIGLHPGIECYDNCEKGWNFYVGESLRKLIQEHKGTPDIPKTKRGEVSHN